MFSFCFSKGLLCSKSTHRLAVQLFFLTYYMSKNIIYAKIIMQAVAITNKTSVLWNAGLLGFNSHFNRLHSYSVWDAVRYAFTSSESCSLAVPDSLRRPFQRVLLTAVFKAFSNCSHQAAVCCLCLRTKSVLDLRKWKCFVFVHFQTPNLVLNIYLVYSPLCRWSCTQWVHTSIMIQYIV